MFKDGGPPTWLVIVMMICFMAVMGIFIYSLYRRTVF